MSNDSILNLFKLQASRLERQSVQLSLLQTQVNLIANLACVDNIDMYRGYLQDVARIVREHAKESPSHLAKIWRSQLMEIEKGISDLDG